MAVTANASGFSGGVLFQPFFNFVLGLPIEQSIATGIATETVGMSSGAYRYARMRKVDTAAVREQLGLHRDGRGRWFRRICRTDC